MRIVHAACQTAAFLIAAPLVAAGLAGATATAATDRPDLTAWRRPLTIPFPQAAPYDPLVATLGKMLYFDPRLSGAQNMSCATCHNPSFGWEVPVRTAIGAMNTPLARQAPTILNVAWGRHFFWDGRAATLEEQASGPITAAVEMNLEMKVVIDRLEALETYVRAFRDAFPGRGLTQETVLIAIATYERTVVSGWSPFDRWVEGDEDAIPAAAKRGFALFTGKARCALCHTGWTFTDDLFHDIGLDVTDIGRAEFDPDDPLMRHAFKTPGLRNTAYRAPYMHNGALETLEEVVWHYVGGGIDRPSLAPLMQPLELDADEVADLVAFMETLTAEQDVVISPVLPTR